jgi:hypothetical protein
MKVKEKAVLETAIKSLKEVLGGFENLREEIQAAIAPIEELEAGFQEAFDALSEKAQEGAKGEALSEDIEVVQGLIAQAGEIMDAFDAVSSLIDDADWET